MLGLVTPSYSADVNAWPSTCPTVSDVQGLTWSHVLARNDILTKRREVETFAAEIDAYAICLNSALQALVASRQQAGRSIDPVVSASVADLLQNAARRKSTTISSYSLVVSNYNASLTKPGDFDGVSDLNISTDLPPASATIPMPTGTPPLSIGAHLLHGSNYFSSDCSKALGKARQKGPLEGTAEVAFDVTDKGALTNVRLYKTSGIDALDAVAVICVGGYIYMPAILGGYPVAEPGHVAPITFETITLSPRS